jgi:hypothetical protein
MGEDLESLVKTLRKTCYQQCREIAKLRASVRELEAQLDPMMAQSDLPDPDTLLVEVPADDIDTRQIPWLDPREERLLRHLLGRDAVTVGSDPYEEKELDALLSQCGIQTYAAPCDVEVMIVGRNGWSEEALDGQLKERVGRRLRVYSQEMVFEAVHAGHGLFDRLSVTELLAIAGDHPALEYLRQSGFAWPSAFVRLGRRKFIVNSSWLEEGLLKHLGYTVGRNAPTDQGRREVLREAYQADLVPGGGHAL